MATQEKADQLIDQFCTILRNLHYALFQGKLPLYICIREKAPKHVGTFSFQVWHKNRRRYSGCYFVARTSIYDYLKQVRRTFRHMKKTFGPAVTFPARMTPHAILTAIAVHELRHQIQYILRKGRLFSRRNTPRKIDPSFREYWQGYLTHAYKRKRTVRLEFDANMIEHLALQVYARKGFAVKEIAKIIRLKARKR
jgi:hypothetical protein